MIKYSERFERDYDFYLKNRNLYTFCGTVNTKHIAIHDVNGKTAKECFHSIDSEGKI